MRRRTVLALLGGATVGVAGCLGDWEDNENDASPGNGNSSATTNQTGENDTPGHPPRAAAVDEATVVELSAGGYERGPECAVEPEAIEVEIDGEMQTYETVGTIPYPDPPTTFTEEAVVDYVIDHEEAYVYHTTLCDTERNVTSVFYKAEIVRKFDWYEAITVVAVARYGAAGGGVDEEGRRWVATPALNVVIYAVDETGIARMLSPGLADSWVHPDEWERVAPDPLIDGDLIYRF